MKEAFNNYITIVLIIVSVFGYSQNPDEILIEYFNEKKNKKEYSVHMNYSTYKGKNGTDKIESYDGVESRLNDCFYQEIGPMKFVYGKDFMVKLNKEEKAMLVRFPYTTPLSNWEKIDEKVIIDQFKDRQLIDKIDYWVLILKPKNNSISSTYSKMEIHISKKGLKLLKHIFYYALSMDFSSIENKSNKPNYKKPRLEITYSKHSNKSLIKKSSFNKERFFNYVDNNIIASKHYQGYEIIIPNNSNNFYPVNE